MNFLFDDFSPSTSPPDTEAVRLGAQRIRELKDLLQGYLSPVFNTDGSFKTNFLPPSALQNGNVDTLQLKDQSVTATKLNNAAFGDGLLKAANADPVTVNVDNVTIGFDSSSPKKIQVLTVPVKNGAAVGSASNLLVQTASVSTLTIAADEVVLKDASKNSFLATAVSVTVNIAFGVALNGLETGATETASTWYYIWLISDGTNIRAVLEDGSSVLNGGGAGVAPSGPDLSNAVFTEYTFKALVGSVRNDGSSNFITFYQQDREVFIDESAVFTAKTGVTSWTAISGSDLTSAQGILPPNAKQAWGNAGGNNNNPGIAVAGDANALGARIAVAANIGGSLLSFEMAAAWRAPLKTAQTVYYIMANITTGYRLTISGYKI